jgi:hypothetical protein
LARLSKSAVALSLAVGWLPFIFDRPRDLVPLGRLLGMTSPVVSQLISVRYFQTTLNFLEKDTARHQRCHSEINHQSRDINERRHEWRGGRRGIEEVAQTKKE